MASRHKTSGEKLQHRKAPHSKHTIFASPQAKLNSITSNTTALEGLEERMNNGYIHARRSQTLNLQIPLRKRPKTPVPPLTEISHKLARMKKRLKTLKAKNLQLREFKRRMERIEQLLVGAYRENAALKEELGTEDYSWAAIQAAMAALKSALQKHIMNL